MAETVIMETAVENAVNIRIKGYSLCLDEFSGLYGGFAYRVVIMLDNAHT